MMNCTKGRRQEEESLPLISYTAQVRGKVQESPVSILLLSGGPVGSVR